VKRCVWFILIFVVYISWPVQGQKNAPPLPQRVVTASVVQDLDFGQIILEDNSAGGQVIIDYTGTRSVTGSLYLYPNDVYDQAILSFKLCPGRSVNVIYSSSTSLSNGSYTMDMSVDKIRIGNTLLTASGQSFFSNKGCDETHYMELGTTLYVVGSHATNPAGTYTGSFSVTLAFQ
jgi:hypothetical protein